jgi:hypothetical protein
VLAAYPCRAECGWSRAGTRAGLPLFRCAGCGSEWNSAEPWTPAERDGSVADAVRAERDRARPGPGQ